MARTPGGLRRPHANPKATITDWLNLVEPDGAFLTSSELNAAFPQGFEQIPPEHRTELRARTADLDGDPAARAELRRWLLGEVLQWDDLLVEDQGLPAISLVRMAEHGVSLRPAQGLVDVDDANRLRLGVFTWPLGTRLDRRSDLTTAGDLWPASPVQRAEAWCRESGVPLALVTDDDQWVLVWAPRGAPAASGRWRVGDLADEKVLQAGLVSLLGARRFFAVGEHDTVEKLFERAADSEVAITKGLGSSVRRSVELLVAAMSRDDVGSEGRVLAGVAPTEVYESAVTVLMRLVFLLFAEERRLLPAEDPLWAESYSVLTLRDDLRQDAGSDGDDALERRSTAWHRLLGTFRAVHGGVNHDRLTLPAYGGSLFDPDRFPFLEGRRTPDHLRAGGVDLGPVGDAPEGPGRPVAIDDRTVLAILEALLTIEVKSGRSKVAQRVSYKALDVEQIGHCYEGLLDHGCAPVEELALGLIGPEGAEPEIPLTELEDRLARGEDELCEWLADKERCKKTASALAKELERQPEGVELARLRAACGHDDRTVERVLPFWGLIRTDLRRLPVVLLPGSQFVTQTSTRRNMGAQYTTKALAEEVVRYALEPLVYDPGPQNEPDQEKWKLRNPAALLDLRICDPAVGSGAILTAAGRYLADRLVESVAEHGPGEGLFASRLANLVAAPPEEQVVLARREVVDHCLYGVDKNPVAAEMAKLSLWLTTMARERPFTFLDHAIQVGDSLLGITDIEQLRWLHLDPAARKGKAGFGTLALDARIAEAADLARRIRELSVVTVRDAIEKQRLHEQLRADLADLVVVADAVVGAALSTAGQSGTTAGQRLDTQLERIRAALDRDRPEAERLAALAVLDGTATAWLRTDLPDDIPQPWERYCLHWPLAFPEVLIGGGRFDVIVGNPPYRGGQYLTGDMGEAYRELLVSSVAGGSRGLADLAGYFLLLASRMAKRLGLLTTNTISQGDTREVGLDALYQNGWSIYRAQKSEPWPNEAAVFTDKIWLASHQWGGLHVLDGVCVSSITPSLTRPSRATGNPYRLASNRGISFEGNHLWGDGFIISKTEAESLIREDPRNREVVFPNINGKQLNTSPVLEAGRWVINFFDWPMDRAQTYGSCFGIVETRVRPGRMLINRERNRERWWLHGEPRPGLYRAIANLERVIVMTKTSRTAAPAFVSARQVLDKGLAVFALDDDAHFGVLSSGLHYWWAVRYASTMKGDLRYTPSDAFETFPLPEPQCGPRWEVIETVGRELNEFRADLMIRTNLGLTKTYNRVHDPGERDPDVVRLRELHVELDHAVRDAYGWSDLELDHHHWETPQGMRFTVGPEAKDELLDRLLELNHERYAAEVTAGLHDKKARKAPAKKAAKNAADPGQESLL